MKHLGDITKIDGHTVPSVDIVVGGSPCQDLSVAGLRKGLQGERSGLFMEQIRIIKEMRDEYRKLHPNEPVRPRYMLFENVPGLLSSNGGEDFRTVLEETVKISDPNAVIPRPKGKWSTSGSIVGEGYTLCWRTHDARWFGVPQRRRRLCMLVDFDGDSACRVLFELERKALSDSGDEAD